MTHQNQQDFSSVKGHMARGAVWMVAMRWSLRLVGLVNTIIMARLLSPTDFGIIAMAWIIVDFLTMLAETDVDVALVRNPQATRDHYDTAWTIKILSGLAIAAALFLVAPLVALYYGDERVTTVMRIVSLRAALMGFENIGVADFRKTLDFSKEYRYFLVRRLSVFVIGLILAALLRDYLALVLATVVAAVVTVAVSFVMSPYRPRLSLAKWREMGSFSQWQMLFNSAQFAGQRVDEFIIGGLGKAADIGNYYVAVDISTMPTREVVQPLGRAVIPTCARIAHDPDEMGKAFRSVLGFVALICIPAGVGISVVAEDLVMAVLGDKWGGAVWFFRWLGIYGALEGMLLAMEPFLMARSQEKLLALANLAYLLILTPALLFAGFSHGIEMIAVTRTAIMGLFVAVVFSVIMRHGWIGWRQLSAILWRPAIAAAVMGTVVLQFHPELEWRVLSLAHDVALGAGIFTLVLLTAWWLSGKPAGAESALLETAARQWRRLVG